MQLENFEIFGILLELNVIGVIGTVFGLELRVFLSAIFVKKIVL